MYGLQTDLGHTGYVRDLQQDLNECFTRSTGCLCQGVQNFTFRFVFSRCIRLKSFLGAPGPFQCGKSFLRIALEIICSVTARMHRAVRGIPLKVESLKSAAGLGKNGLSCWVCTGPLLRPIKRENTAQGGRGGLAQNCNFVDSRVR